MSKRVHGRANDIRKATNNKITVPTDKVKTYAEIQAYNKLIGFLISNSAITQYPELLGKIKSDVKSKEDFDRVANCLRRDAAKYKEIYLNFTTNIKPNFTIDISEQEKLLKEAIESVDALSINSTDSELVHSALKKIGAASHALIFLQQTKIDLLFHWKNNVTISFNEMYQTLPDEIKRKESVKKSLLLISPFASQTSANVGNIISAENNIKVLSANELQVLRDQVLQMVFNKKPLDDINLYQGKRVGGEDAVRFFKTHYAPFIIPGCEVIFAPDLKAIDEKLLIALRNECRHGVLVPIGTRSQKTDALIQGRFTDEKFSARKAHLAIAYRELRNAKAEILQSKPA